MNQEMENAFTEIERSEDDFIEHTDQSRDRSTKRFVDEDYFSAQTENRDNKSVKRKRKDRVKKEEPKKKNGTRKIVNLPATQPYIKIVDGEEKMAFRYNTRLSESTLNLAPKESVVDDEFTIDINIDSVDITTLNEKFKIDNCIYPRANIPREKYTGNRWSYETECNKYAWQLVSLNSLILYGKKGLIQRAVDSLRQINRTTMSTKYFKDDLFPGDFERRKVTQPQSSTAQMEYSFKGTQRKTKVFLGIKNLDFEKIPDKFKSKYSVFPEEYDENSFGQPTVDYKNPNNFLAIKLGFLNLENATFQNAVKMIGLTAAIKGLVELYKSSNTRQNESVDDEKDADVVVMNALDEALDDAENENNFYFNAAERMKS